MIAYTADEARNKLRELRALRSRVEAQMDEMVRIIDAADRPPVVHRRSRHEIPECGTESAYQRHRYYGEERDDACTRAHAEHTREQARERRNRRLQIVDAA